MTTITDFSKVVIGNHWPQQLTVQPLSPFVKDGIVATFFPESCPLIELRRTTDRVHACYLVLYGSELQELPRWLQEAELIWRAKGQSGPSAT